MSFRASSSTTMTKCWLLDFSLLGITLLEKTDNFQRSFNRRLTVKQKAKTAE